MDQNLLKKHLIYKEGHLWWLEPHKFLPYLKGRSFGQYTHDGYIRGRFLNKRYFEHRLIWFYHYGKWPKEFLDHINRVRDDNRIENLREVNRSQNGHNTVSKPGSSSKYPGVGWHKNRNKWISRIRINGKLHHLGYYDKESDAADTYTLAKARLTCQAAIESHGITLVEWTK